MMRANSERGDGGKGRLALAEHVHELRRGELSAHGGRAVGGLEILADGRPCPTWMRAASPDALPYPTRSDGAKLGPMPPKLWSAATPASTVAPCKSNLRPLVLAGPIHLATSGGTAGSAARLPSVSTVASASWRAAARRPEWRVRWASYRWSPRPRCVGRQSCQSVDRRPDFCVGPFAGAHDRERCERRRMTANDETWALASRPPVFDESTSKPAASSSNLRRLRAR